MTTNVCTPEEVMHIQADVIEADVQFLLGLESMGLHRLQALTELNKLQHVSLRDNLRKGWRLDVIRRDGHAILPFTLIRAELVAF